MNSSDLKRITHAPASRGARRNLSVFMIVALAYGLSSCGTRDFHFEEEVQLASGEVIKVGRSVSAESLGEIGGPGGWEAAYMSLVIVTPKRPENPPRWESNAGLLPILFDRDPDNGEWTLLATFYTCEPWYALGRPKLPYAEFRVRTGQWQRTDLSSKWIGRAANVLTDLNSGGEPQFVGLSAKQARMSDRRIAPKYRSIVEHWTTGC